MDAIESENLSPAQSSRLKKFSAEQSVDIHCHCLANLDDGPKTLADSLALCRSLVLDGITTVIATPHQLGAYEGINSATKIRSAVKTLADALMAAQIPLQIHPGADVRIDDQLIALLHADQILTLADTGAHILLELPHEILIDLKPVIIQLLQRNITPIISHPERHGSICRKPEVILPWLEAGALFQVTAASLLGAFEAQAQRTAWQLIEAGVVSLIASDAHDVQRRPPMMTQAIDAVIARLGHAVARRLCIENPAHVLNGTEIAPPRSPVRTAFARGRAW